MGIDVLRSTDAAWTALYFGLLEVLQADETLQQVGVNWSVMDGDRYTADPPSDNELPWIRLWPPSLPAEEEVLGQYSLVSPVRVEVVTATLNYRDHGNLWGALYDALLKENAYKGTTLALWFNALGAFDYTLRGDQPPAPWPQAGAVGGNNLRSAGAVVFRLFTDA